MSINSTDILTECCYCGFLNYESTLSCRACARETDSATHSNSENDSYSDSGSSFYENSQLQNQIINEPTPTPSTSSDNDFNTFISVSEPEQFHEPQPQYTSKNITNNIYNNYETNVMNFIANDNIAYETDLEIFVSNIPEDMANENLGSSQLFGMFGDIKQVSIIRDRISVNPTAKITFYSINSIVELMKLSIAYDNHLCNI